MARSSEMVTLFLTYSYILASSLANSVGQSASQSISQPVSPIVYSKSVEETDRQPDTHGRMTVSWSIFKKAFKTGYALANYAGLRIKQSEFFEVEAE